MSLGWHVMLGVLFHKVLNATLVRHPSPCTKMVNSFHHIDYINYHAHVYVEGQIEIVN